MKYHPNLIMYKVFSRYLSESDQVKFDKLLSKYKDQRRKYFYNGMLKYFNIEKLRTEPLLWEDIWIYNYCNYEITDKIRRNGLISKYEREVFIYDELEFQNYLKKRNKK